MSVGDRQRPIVSLSYSYHIGVHTRTIFNQECTIPGFISDGNFGLRAVTEVGCCDKRTAIDEDVAGENRKITGQARVASLLADVASALKPPLELISTGRIRVVEQDLAVPVSKDNPV